MSFSGEIKAELLKTIPAARHCQMAELAAFLRFLAPAEAESGQGIRIRADNAALKNRVFTLLEKAFNIDIALAETETRMISGRTYLTAVPEGKTAEAIRRAVRHPMLLAMSCCRQSFLRGAFLTAGSISAPEKYYHLEIIAPDEDCADLVTDTMRALDLSPRRVIRKGGPVIYLKEGEQIVRMVGEIGAPIALLKLENIRVTREVKGNVNRRVNCETANLLKTVVSAQRQVEDIAYLRSRKEYAALSPALKEMAEIRLQYPDMPLAELGNMLDPRIGKSGVNHRLRKISQIARDLREKETEA